MPRGIQPKGIARRNKMLRAAIQLFLFQGYEKTTTASIARSAGFTPSSFFAAFENKEALLLTLTKRMFADQFTLTEEAFASRNDPLLLYGVETALQLAMTELSENLRDIYVEAYTFPATAEIIHRSTTAELQAAFSAYLPGCAECDFYEMELGTAGMMRGYMARRCDPYFTLERKIRRYLSMSLSALQVPAQEREQVIAFVAEIDMLAEARKVVDAVLASLSVQFDLKG
jgi:AcrR family transcriptional regulator